MQTYTETQINALYEAQLNGIAYSEPEQEQRLTAEISAKRAEINEFKKNPSGNKSDYFTQLNTLDSELQELIAEDLEIRDDNTAAVQAARSSAVENATNDQKSQARKVVVNQVLRESDWIVAADSRISSDDFDDWIGYREALRAWGVSGGTIPESPEEPSIDPDATNLIDRLNDQDSAILGILEVML